jgi:hypothetical protein
VEQVTRSGDRGHDGLAGVEVADVQQPALERRAERIDLGS